MRIEKFEYSGEGVIDRRTIHKKTRIAHHKNSQGQSYVIVCFDGIVEGNIEGVTIYFDSDGEYESFLNGGFVRNNETLEDNE